jgi:hypothetical protein
MVSGRRPDDEAMPKAATNTSVMFSMYTNGFERVKKAEPVVN